MGRNGHNGAGAVAGKHVLGDPDGDALPGEGIDAVRAGEHAGDGLGLGDALTLSLLLHLLDVLLDSFLLLGRSQFRHEVALGGKHHKGDAEYGIHAGGEYRNVEMLVAVDSVEHHLGALGLAYPIALHFLEGIGPGELVEAVEEASGIGRDAKLPLGHLLLLHGEAAAHREAVLDFVIGQHGAEALAPVDGSLALVSDAVVHQGVGLLLLGHRIPLVCSELELLRARGVNAFGTFGREIRDEVLDRTGLLKGTVVPAAEHLEESPLGPFVELRIAGTDLAVPVIGKAYPVELAAVAVDIVGSGLLRMLTRLDGVLLGRKAESVISHRMQHIVSCKTLVTGEDVACDVSKRMSYVESRSGRIREHIEDVVFRFGRILSCLECLVGGPPGLPFAFD